MPGADAPATVLKTVAVGMTLVNDESGEAATLVLEPMLGHAILRACLVDALSSMRFAPTSAPVRIRRTIRLGPSDEVEIAAKLVLRETINKWRFKPLIVGGQPHVSCTERTFRIGFEVW